MKPKLILILCFILAAVTSSAQEEKQKDLYFGASAKYIDFIHSSNPSPLRPERFVLPAFSPFVSVGINNFKTDSLRFTQDLRLSLGHSCHSLSYQRSDPQAPVQETDIGFLLTSLNYSYYLRLSERTCLGLNADALFLLTSFTKNSDKQILRDFEIYNINTQKTQNIIPVSLLLGISMKSEILENIYLRAQLDYGISPFIFMRDEFRTNMAFGELGIEYLLDLNS